MVQRDTPWEPGTPCWVDLMTTDVEAANDFYRQLFGWQIEVGPPETGGYGMCLVNGRPVAGTMAMQEGNNHPPVWSTYLATEDADATMIAAEKAGATVLAPVMDVMQFGRMGVFQLPSGGAVGLWQSGTHHGFALSNEPGAVAWNEFMTRDYEGAKSFYGEVFGYQYQEIEDAGFNYATISLDGQRPIGGIGELPPGVPQHIPPHWRVYFEVADADAAAARTTELGGTVIQEPRDMPYGRWVDLADPQGAMFSAIRTAWAG
jgi:predicted enzyme related to lactoylglutathione lyase